MYLACPQCDRRWRYPCDPCASAFLTSHKADTGHDITILETREEPSPVVYPRRPMIPDWMRGTA